MARQRVLERVVRTSLTAETFQALQNVCEASQRTPADVLRHCIDHCLVNPGQIGIAICLEAGLAAERAERMEEVRQRLRLAAVARHLPPASIVEEAHEMGIEIPVELLALEAAGHEHEEEPAQEDPADK